ncbi:MAG: hypothetical protein HC802_16620 [Caldilineaceae bacterium]|nr:hypothetical protein [Caldilineaceae bacterium]
MLHALNDGDHLLIEAGTGTGKSLAYLLPSLLWSAQNQRRVVVATNTIALQDQLIDKDLPQAVATAKAQGHPAARYALLKGRSNYLCTRRLDLWRGNRRLNIDEVRVLAKILVWLPTTRDGDVNELFLHTPAERSIWQSLCSDSASCSPERCHPSSGAFRHSALPAVDYFCTPGATPKPHTSW